MSLLRHCTGMQHADQRTLSDACGADDVHDAPAVQDAHELYLAP